MNLFKLYKHDFRNGLLRWRYLAAIGLWFVPSLIMYDILQFRNEPGTWMDYLLYIFRGADPIANVSTLEQIQLPIPWIVVMGGGLFLNLDYFLNDVTTAGQQILVRCKSRRKWYLSKCLWNMTSSFFYFALGLIAPIFLSLLGGSSMELSNSPILTTALFGTMEPIELSGLAVFSVAIVLPYLSLATLSMLQMTLCLFVKPVFSFLTCICLLVVSIFWNSPLSIGNGAMTLRSSLIVDGGIDPNQSVLACLAVLSACIIIGTVTFRKYDILGIEE